jgi:predicted Rossmann fold nucleotide-binding protein DprA/Smf involved in DNA uptake
MASFVFIGSIMPCEPCKVGNLNLFNKDPIAIIGARSASINGKALARSIAHNICAKSNVAIVSGLAKGISACWRYI